MCFRVIRPQNKINENLLETKQLFYMVTLQGKLHENNIFLVEPFPYERVYIKVLHISNEFCERERKVQMKRKIYTVVQS